jgi:hypothetical protein
MLNNVIKPIHSFINKWLHDDDIAWHKVSAVGVLYLTTLYLVIKYVSVGGAWPGIIVSVIFLIPLLHLLNLERFTFGVALVAVGVLGCYATIGEHYGWYGLASFILYSMLIYLETYIGHF